MRDWGVSDIIKINCIRGEEKTETGTKKKQKVDDQLLPKSVSGGKIKL